MSITRKLTGLPGGFLLPDVLPSQIIRADYEGATSLITEVGPDFSTGSNPITLDAADYPSISGKSQSFSSSSQTGGPNFSSTWSDKNLTSTDYYFELWIKNTVLAQARYVTSNYTGSSDWGWAIGSISGGDIYLVWANFTRSQFSGFTFTGGWDHLIVQHDFANDLLTFGFNGDVLHYDTSAFLNWPDGVESFNGMFGSRQSNGWVGKIGGFRVGTDIVLPSDIDKYRVPTALWS